jgi:hypothetical protein
MPGRSIYLFGASWALRLTSIFCIIISSYFLLLSKDFPADGDVFPIFATGTTIILALILMVSSFIKANIDSSKKFYLNVNYNTFKPLFLIVLSILYIIGITEIGYFVSSIAFLYITTYAVGIRNLKAITMTGVILFPTMYGFFVFLLHAQLPRGILF